MGMLSGVVDPPNLCEEWTQAKEKDEDSMYCGKEKEDANLDVFADHGGWALFLSCSGGST